MKFVFEAKASDYDLAAEQEILLRHVSNRKRNWTRAVILCAATVVLCILRVGLPKSQPRDRERPHF